MSAVRESFSAEAIVCQCGTDGIVGDPMACFNLTPLCLVHCIQYLLAFRLPLVLLGGGMPVIMAVSFVVRPNWNTNRILGSSAYNSLIVRWQIIYINELYKFNSEK